MGGAEREEGQEAGEVQPALLQELANLDPAHEVGPDDEVLLDREEEAAAGGDDDEAPAKAGIPAMTKAVVVAAAWLLLTLFLVDRFSDDPGADGSTRLDQVAVGEEEDEARADDHQGDDGEGSDDAWADDSGAGEAGAGAGARSEVVAVAGADPVAGGDGGGTYPGVPAQVSGGVGGGSAAPGAAPSATSSTATAGPPGGGGGSATTAPSTGAATTTTTLARSGGGSGGGGGSTDTTAVPAPAEHTITILVNKNQGKWVYDTASLSVPSGSRVRMVNESNTAHTWKIGDGPAIELPAKASTDYRTFTSTVTFRCTRHDYMIGEITVT